MLFYIFKTSFVSPGVFFLLWGRRREQVGLCTLSFTFGGERIKGACFLLGWGDEMGPYLSILPWQGQGLNS